MAALALPVRVMAHRGEYKLKKITDRKRLATSGYECPSNLTLHAPNTIFGPNNIHLALSIAARSFSFTQSP
jgi:hypothetical protein